MAISGSVSSSASQHRYQRLLLRQAFRTQLYAHPQDLQQQSTTTVERLCSQQKEQSNQSPSSQQQLLIPKQDFQARTLKRLVTTMALVPTLGRLSLASPSAAR